MSNNRKTAKAIKELQERYARSHFENLKNLQELERDLKKYKIKESEIDWVTGLICNQRRDYVKAVQLFLNAYQANPSLLALEYIFVAYQKVSPAFNLDAQLVLLNTILDAIREAYKKETKIIVRAKLNSYFAYCVFVLRTTFEEKQKIARKWSKIITQRSSYAEMLNFFAGPTEDLHVSAFRFFAHILAFLGLEKEVIEMNKNIVESSKVGDFVHGKYDTAKLYSSLPQHQFPTDLFCKLLIDFPFVKSGLDLGCGPGRVGLNIGKFCQHLTGIEINKSYAEFAKKSGHYSKVIVGDVTTELPKLSKKFDLITACMVFDYLPGEKILKMAEKKLKVGGHLAFTFIPSLRPSDDKITPTYHYKYNFYESVTPKLSLVKSQMRPYMWTGGYYILLRRNF